MLSLIWRDGEEPDGVGCKIWSRPAVPMGREMLVSVAPGGRGPECLIRPGGLGSQGGQKRGPHCCCYSYDGLRHRAPGCWGR